jgi:hypothetical protein
MNDINITFQVRGYVVQEIEMRPDANISTAQLIEMLNDGRAVTGIFSSLNVITRVGDGRVLATVKSTLNNTEYREFVRDP